MSEQEHLLPVEWRAYIARNALLHLGTYWIPDGGEDGTDIDPLDDPEVRDALRTFLPKLFAAKVGDRP